MAWLSDYQYRKEIVIDHTKIDSNLSDFPILVKLTDTNFIFPHARSDGYDIRFTSSDGETLLKYEREAHDSVNEEAYYWVKIPSVDSSTDTEIYIYYGNASASDGADAVNVWTNSFVAVYHLADDLANTTVEDSLNANDGTSNTNTVNMSIDAGQIYKALNMNGDYVNFGTGSPFNFGTSDFSISIWIKTSGISSEKVLVAKRAWSVATEDGYAMALLNNTTLRVHYYNDQDYTISNIADGNWHKIRVDFDYSPSQTTVYLDGNIVTTKSHTQDNQSNSSALYIGRSNAGLYFPGDLDNFEVLDVKRGSTWEKADYFSHTDALLNFGEEQNKNIDINEQINLIDDWNISVNPETYNIEENIILDENWNIFTYEYSNFASKIISYNPLIYITNSIPAKIIKVDITDPENPIKYTYEIISNNYAKDIIFNSSNDYFYVICSDGKVVKVNKNNLNDQTIIDTGDTDNLLNVDSIDTMFLTFVSTDDEEGELIILDEREVKKLNTDLRWNQEVRNIIQTRLNTILGKIIFTDLRFKVNIVKSIKTDLRWLEKSYSTISQYPINYTDFEVYINGVLLSAIDDIDMNSIVITHDITQEEEKASQAQFVLNRYHDKLNYTHAGLFSEITNNNNVIIKIKGRTEFTGKISNLSAVSETETVNVLAIGKRPQYNKRRVNIPLSSVNETLHLYHCLNHNTQINKSILDTYMVITKSDSLYWDGNDWTGYIKDAMTFINYTTAKNYIDSNNELRQYTSQEVYPINRDYSPEIYKGIIANLGISVEQNVIKLNAILDITTLAEKIEDSKFIPKQNWTYFWLAKFTHLILNLTKGTLQYIGTSLSSLFTDVWKITGCSYKIQKILDDTEIDLGDYILGEEPYLRINTKNGKKIVKDKWADKDDGLYRERDEGYDYEEYVKRIADLEYQKLHNINGDILPITSSDVLISLDAYYYYDIKLLTRINLTNTTSQNSYKNSNGFPVAVKTIRIQCNQEGENTMSVQLTCDNQLSFIELENIDRLYPNDEDYITQEESILNYRKFNPTSWSYVS